MLGLSDHLEDLYHTRDDIIQIQILNHHIQTSRLTLGPFQQIVQQIVYIL